MNGSLKFSETRVESVLKSAPNAASFFLHWKTACAGCCFARFCTLKDVVNAYQLDEEKFLKAVEKLIVQKS